MYTPTSAAFDFHFVVFTPAGAAGRFEHKYTQGAIMEMNFVRFSGVFFPTAAIVFSLVENNVITIRTVGANATR